jgi:hypothetical protein
MESYDAKSLRNNSGRLFDLKLQAAHDLDVLGLFTLIIGFSHFCKKEASSQTSSVKATPFQDDRVLSSSADTYPQ